VAADPQQDQSIGCLALFLWSAIGEPGTAFLTAEAFFRVLDLTGESLLMATVALVGTTSWLVYRACGFDPVRSISYALISYLPGALLFALYAHSVSRSLN
jgi:hypothetical protein